MAFARIIHPRHGIDHGVDVVVRTHAIGKGHGIDHIGGVDGRYVVHQLFHGRIDGHLRIPSERHVTNTTGQEIPAGTLTLAMNAFYTFVSRNDIQDWSEGNGRIPTPQSVGQADVPALQPGASANVSIDADAHQESLAAINSWGPKPVLLSYSANGTPLAQSHTFVTRTGAGLHTPSTPALHITVAQPLAANGWTTDSKLLGQLVDEGGISSSKLAKIAMPSKDDDARLKSLQQTFAKHDMLQVVGDPTYLQAMAMPRGRRHHPARIVRHDRLQRHEQRSGLQRSRYQRPSMVRSQSPENLSIGIGRQQRGHHRIRVAGQRQLDPTSVDEGPPAGVRHRHRHA
mgnify:CR=1 FL=1